MNNNLQKYNNRQMFLRFLKEFERLYHCDNIENGAYLFYRKMFTKTMPHIYYKSWKNTPATELVYTIHLSNSGYCLPYTYFSMIERIDDNWYTAFNKLSRKRRQLTKQGLFKPHLTEI